MRWARRREAIVRSARDRAESVTLLALWLPLLAQEPTAGDAARALLFIGILVALGLICAAIYVGSIAWAAMDAANRGKPWLLVALLVALVVWPIGLILWLVYRPKKRG